MKLSKLVLSLMLISGLLVGGGMSWTGCTSNKAEAEELAAKLFEAIRDKEYDKALTLYSAEFSEKTPRDEMLKVLKNANVKLGDLESYELTSSSSIEGIWPTSRSATYTLKYKVQYSKYSTVEILTIFKQAGGELKITEHTIDLVQPILSRNYQNEP